MKIKDYFYSKEVFSVSKSKSWKGILQTNPIPNNLDSYYNTEDYLSHNTKKKSFFSFLYYFIKFYNLKNKYQLIYKENHEKAGSILDYGCGTGDFLKICKNNDWNIYGIEPNKKAAKQASKTLNITISSNLNTLEKNQFDIITLWHVLEHIPNLEETTKKILNLLKPNGTLIIAVPNYESFDAKYYKKYWAAWDVPRHIWHFSRNGIQLFFQRQNCKIKSIKPMWFDAFYVSWLSAKYQNNIIKILLFPIIALLSNSIGFFTKEVSSQIYIIKKDK